MFSWIGNAVSDISSWLGDGVASLFNWLFGGLQILLTKLIDAFSGFWDVLDSLWEFAIGFKDSVFDLFTAFFPFVPAPVTTVIFAGFVAVLVAGIYKKVRS
jgi:hypothetical protein